MENFDALSFILGLLAGGIIAVIFLRRGGRQEGDEARLEALLQSLDARLENQTKDLLTSMGDLREGSSKSIGEAFMKTQSSLSESLSRSQREIEEKLKGVLRETGEIKGAAELMLKVGKDVEALGKVLGSSGKRGAFGEMQLEMLLKDVIPGDRMKTQYRLASGAVVDAAIFMRDDLLLCIDSKFPVANLMQSYEAEGDEAARLKKAFYADVKKRAEEIASKYIVQQQTMNFAFMFIPSESVFLEIVANGDLHRKLMEMGVIPASPNFLYVYLHALAIGFKGMSIEEKTKEIMDGLSALAKQYGAFNEKFALTGKHLDNAKNAYADAEKQAGKFASSLDSLEKLDSSSGEK